ncbi:MAG: 50S ribosomal protein L4 [Bacteroidetes bacterium GWC2_33_15]|nr:MAG: 50S ribosomal protein L4 [Bacteroidetes bacterium GWA2_33_15]OFX52462.1 MAG: 50S ribosomal protein L4 [Bacteroidetes bacterium GWC2_33_15]OFX65524.1 MAG: 50S ribosomal protein L4 [Bacteroidetes bacterium GWB2_32_14]OFX67544.1 MAG: 50S ribosomal protein L4 [Bacteroidetes bacterium GWD2_33_33]HAN18413.1 50S ribosomal protein L4 [Bacteroidales bacterium]
MELNIINIAGEDTGKKVTLNDSIFKIEPNDHAIYLDVKQYLANKRQGTHKAKEKSEVSGSTRKLKRQKGTGTARAGSIKSPLLRGGARVFGPQPRDYSFKLNKKVKQLARKSALTYKAIDNNIKVLENFNFDVPKTKEFVNLRNNLDVKDKKVLLVLSEQNKSIYLSSRNLEDVKVVTISDLATYDIMNASVVLFVENSIEPLNKMFRI